MKKKSTENPSVKLIKVLSDTDDAVTLAIKRADKRDRREKKRQKEVMNMRQHMPERDYVRSKIYSERGVSLPPPSTRLGFRGKVSDSEIEVGATLSLHHIQRNENEFGSLAEAKAYVPALSSVDSVRRRKRIVEGVAKRLSEVNEGSGYHKKRMALGHVN